MSTPKWEHLPDWKKDVLLKIFKSLSSNEVLKRAEKILDHKAVEDARKILNEAWMKITPGGGEYPNLAEAIHICASFSGSPRPVPSWYFDKKEVARQAKIAREVLRMVKNHLADFSPSILEKEPGMTLIDGPWSEYVKYLEPLQDERGIVHHKKILAPFLYWSTYLKFKTRYPIASRGGGRPKKENLSSALLLLEDQFRKDFHAPMYKAISHLEVAAFPGKQIARSDDNMRKTIEQFKRNRNKTSPKS
jgi:hypothetical protein